MIEGIGMIVLIKNLAKHLAAMTQWPANIITNNKSMD